jgi:hypothetical protein
MPLFRVQAGRGTTYSSNGFACHDVRPCQATYVNTCDPGNFTISLHSIPVLLAVFNSLVRPVQRTILMLLPMLTRLLHLRVQQTISRLCMPRTGTALPKHYFYFLESFASCLRVCEESLNSGPDTKNAEDDEELPSYAFERGRNEETNREIEEPAI